MEEGGGMRGDEKTTTHKRFGEGRKGGCYCWCVCCVVSVLFCCFVSVFIHCTIPESMEACFLVVLGGGGGGVLLGRGGGMCCEKTRRTIKSSELYLRQYFRCGTISLEDWKEEKIDVCLHLSVCLLESLHLSGFKSLLMFLTPAFINLLWLHESRSFITCVSTFTCTCIPVSLTPWSLMSTLQTRYRELCMSMTTSLSLAKDWKQSFCHPWNICSHYITVSTPATLICSGSVLLPVHGLWRRINKIS